MARDARELLRRLRCLARAIGRGLFAVLLVSGCAGEGDVPDRVRVTVLPVLSYAPIHLANAAGDFEAEGIEVEYVRMNATKGALVLLLEDRIDVLGGYITAGLFNALEGGNELRIVADKGYVLDKGCTYQAIVTGLDGPRPDPTTGQVKVDVDRGTMGEFFVDAAFDRAGIEEFRTVAIPRGARIPALRQGTLSAAIMGSTWLWEAAGTEGVRLWARDHEVLPGHQVSALMYGPRLLEDTPDLGRRFMAAYLRGVRRFNEGKTARNLEILGRETGFAREQLERSCWPAIRSDGRVDIESVQRFQRWGVRKGYLDRVQPPERWWSPLFLEADPGRRPGSARGVGGS